MKIGIVGAGNIGGNLSRRLTGLGHQVSVANSRSPDTLTELAAETGASAVLASDAAAEADVVVVTVPLRAVPDLPAGLVDGAADDVVVIDTCNYYPRRDGRIAAIEDGLTESRWVEQQLGVSVVKAFNGIYADHLLTRALPPGGAGRIALPVAGDDAAAKAVVMALVDSLGFDPVDGGGLDDSWRQEPGTPVYGADLDADGVRRALAEAVAGRGPEWRA